MRQDRRPYWVKKIYIRYRTWYTNHFLRPACDELGDYHTVMKPWYLHIGGPNIRIGKCATLVAEPDAWVRPGSYEILINGGRGAGTVVVREGRTSQLQCYAAAARCKVL